MNGRPVTPEEQAAIAGEYVEGASIERLAYKFHRSPQFVRNVILSQGLKTRPPGSRGQRKLDPDQQHTAVGEYQDGATLEMLAEKYGCSPGTMRNVLSDHGVEMRNTGRPSGPGTPTCADVDSAYRKKARARLRERVSGWTPEQFDAAWVVQRGLCAVCEIPMRDHGRYSDSVTVDHDHSTGRPRALLCQQCNKGIGQLKDSPVILKRAATYLEAHMGLTG